MSRWEAMTQVKFRFIADQHHGPMVLGLQGLCERRDNDVVTMSATYTILVWGLLMAIVWAY